MKTKILYGGERICLYCGKEISVRYEDNTPYYECECPDTKKKRKIREEVENLKRTIPSERYEIIERYVLYKVEEY